MRQTSWEGFFDKDEERSGPPDAPRWRRFAIVSWEEIVTLFVVLIVLTAVIASVDRAEWVPEMPSLYGIAFLGLALGLIFAKLGLHEAVAHPIAFAIGTGAVIVRSTSSLEGSLRDRSSELYDRMDLWVEAVFSGGISNDNLPFVVLVVTLSYLLPYVAGWSLFRWYNAWIALVPGGVALLMNISYLPGEPGFLLMVYLFASILLVSRVNVLRGERTWRRERTRYPDLISLHVLNITVWMAIGLLAFAWILPVGGGGGPFGWAWRTATAPIAEPLSDLGRVFGAIDAKKTSKAHNFGTTLPLRGSITLGESEIMQVTATEAGFLRAQAYDFYTAQGWSIGPEVQISSGTWHALRAIQSPQQARNELRRPVSVQVAMSGKANVIVSAGQPLDVNVDSRIVFGPDPNKGDVLAVRPKANLESGDLYRVTSTVTNASEASLRAAPATYPDWTRAYLQLPSATPPEVFAKAREVAAGADNPFDQATQIEQFLRSNYPIRLDIAAAPPTRDSVAYFLFDVQEGYFDYHASAMVVMLRSIGIPSRLVAGYVIRPTDRVPDTSIYVVSGQNSFAWPEVYFPGLGWIEFNPTSSEPAILRTGTDDQAFSDDEFEEDEEPDDAPFIPTDPAEDQLEALQLDEGSNLPALLIMITLGGFVVVTAIGGITFQLVWQRGLGGLPYPVQIWEKTLRLAGWARIRPLPQDTARDVSARLRHELSEVEDLDYLGETFLRARYGRKELPPEDKERLTAVWRNVRNTLLGRLLRWK